MPVMPVMPVTRSPRSPRRGHPGSRWRGRPDSPRRGRPDSPRRGHTVTLARSHRHSGEVALSPRRGHPFTPARSPRTGTSHGNRKSRPTTGNAGPVKNCEWPRRFADGFLRSRPVGGRFRPEAPPDRLPRRNADTCGVRSRVSRHLSALAGPFHSGTFRRNPIRLDSPPVR